MYDRNMRASPRRFIKTLFIVSLMGFIIINMNLFMDSRGLPATQDKDPPAVRNDAANRAIQAIKESNYPIVPLEYLNSSINRTHESPSARHNFTAKNISQVFRLPSRHSNNYSIVTLGDGYKPVGTDPLSIKDYIAQMNKAQRIRNLDRFDLPTSENSAVIVVQVHDRTEYLRILIDSFKRARHIENSLLIFSHDYFSDEVNQLISEIDFCLVLQIYYPIPIQLYPNEFPGESPGDCPRDSNREQAAKLGCTNSQWPDKYGHYREAKYTQTKHHWFWKANHVFDRLKVMKNFNGPVLFVEEDHMMTEDFIHVLQKMYRYRNTACKDCNILTLGTYLKQPVYGAFSKKVDIMNWVSSKHNMGMAFNRQVWDSIKACSEAFCRFDDYNWDWSLQFVSMSCMQAKLRVMLMKSPRIYHIGECGVHHKGKNCDSDARVTAIKKLLADSAHFMFPDQLEVAGYPRTPSKMPKPNGGWGDRRDHELCISFTKPDLH